MARPPKIGLDYFPHDVAASLDEKILALEALHGPAGYATYFKLLECIYQTSDAELNLANPAIFAAISKKIGLTTTKFEKILKSALEVGCFDRKKFEASRVLTSDSIKRRYQAVQSTRERWKKSKVIRVENPTENSTDNVAENSVVMPEIKEKKRKENNNNNSTTMDLSKREGDGGVVVSPPSGEGTESPGAIPGVEAEELAALYTQTTGLDDLSPELLADLMQKTSVTSSYVREKIALLDSPEIRAPLPWLVTAIKNDYRAAQKKADKRGNGGRADPSCPDCTGGGWRMVTIDDSGYPLERAEPCPCAGQVAAATLVLQQH